MSEISKNDLRRTYQRWLELDQNASAVAREYQLNESTIRRRLDQHRKLIRPTLGGGFNEPSPSDLSEVPDVSYTVNVDSRPINEKVRVVFWTDTHDSPGLSKDRFSWIGKYVAETRPDLVVHGGDISSFDSLCSHEPNDTLGGKHKPSFQEDLDSLDGAIGIYREALKGFECPHHITLGNHEDRVFSFVNRNPEVAGFVDLHLNVIFEDHGWTFSRFGDFHYVAGCAFVHVPLSTLGKPYGGVHCENMVARDSLESVCFGHTHRRLCKEFPKTNNRTVTILNGGCSLPDGHIENYAKHSLNGWSYGIYDITIHRNHIYDTWVPMSSLES